MAWTTPVLVEVCAGNEINGYLPSELLQVRRKSAKLGTMNLGGQSYGLSAGFCVSPPA